MFIYSRSTGTKGRTQFELSDCQDIYQLTYYGPLMYQVLKIKCAYFNTLNMDFHSKRYSHVSDRKVWMPVTHFRFICKNVLDFFFFFGRNSQSW